MNTFLEEHNSGFMNWSNAKGYCASLNTEQFGGYTDWRLPNIRELMSIVDYSKDGDNYWYDTHFTLNSSYYWSSTAGALGISTARNLRFELATTESNTSKSNAGYVICTR